MLPGPFNGFDFLLFMDLGQMMLLPGASVCSPLQLQPITSAQTERHTYAIDREQQWPGGRVSSMAFRCPAWRPARLATVEVLAYM
jgi:hypothetical protein